ncbi:MAG TPA: bacteriohemerythrin [Azospirillum sp.]|nr:bacteriohemerythrin [Azospirillum sp.]
MPSNPAMLEWNEGFAIGHPEIDDQHRQLFEVYNAAVRMLAGGASAPEAATILTAIMDYADYHFATEQSAMASAGFPHLKAHIHEHDALRATVTALVSRIDGDPCLLSGLVGLLRVWIQGHILHSDAEFGLFLKARPAQSPA